MESGASVPFLDVRFTIVKDKSLDTDIYYKETDSHNYVPFFSYHPHKTLSNIPFTLVRRICTIVSDKAKLDSGLDGTCARLKRKHYRVWWRVCDWSFSPSESIFITNTRTKYSTTRLIHKCWISYAHPHICLCLCRSRQPPSLKGHLFKSCFETTPQSICGSITPCRKVAGRKPTRGQPCRCCEVFNEWASFKFFGSSEEFELSTQQRIFLSLRSSVLSMFALRCFSFFKREREWGRGC